MCSINTESITRQVPTLEVNKVERIRLNKYFTLGVKCCYDFSDL